MRETRNDSGNTTTERPRERAATGGAPPAAADGRRVPPADDPERVPAPRKPLVRRAAALAYGMFAYTVFLGTFTYLVGFVADVGVPRSIDAAAGPAAPPGQAVATNLGILGLFAVQHSIMARRWFKERWTRIVPPEVERSTFVLVTCAILGLLFAAWQPLAGAVWSVETPALRAALHAVAAAGWGTVLLATFLIDHFDLFGVRQVLRAFRGAPHHEPAFLVRSLYRRVRHPLYLGFLLAFWATPDMSAGRLLFAAATTTFLLVAVRFEESDLVRAHGPEYERYRLRVPMLVPLPGRSW